MKKTLSFLLVTILLLLAITPSTVLAQDPEPGNTISGDQVIVGNTFRLESGETLDGNMLVIGGTASTAQDSTVNGDLVLIGGTLAVNGAVNGDIVSIGGVVNLEDAAIVNGSMTMMGAGLLWVGWFGFNAGSSISSSLSTAQALTAVPNRLMR